MADFSKWERESLEKFAAEACEQLKRNAEDIKRLDAEVMQLRDDCKTMQLAWRNALRAAEANATVKPHGLESNCGYIPGLG